METPISHRLGGQPKAREGVKSRPPYQRKPHGLLPPLLVVLKPSWLLPDQGNSFSRKTPHVLQEWESQQAYSTRIEFKLPSPSSQNVASPLNPTYTGLWVFSPDHTLIARLYSDSDTRLQRQPLRRPLSLSLPLSPPLPRRTTNEMPNRITDFTQPLCNKPPRLASPAAYGAGPEPPSTRAAARTAQRKVDHITVLVRRRPLRN
jgi:hypothetical protein